VGEAGLTLKVEPATHLSAQSLGCAVVIWPAGLQPRKTTC
jgi:hypothetical protein